MTISTTAMLTVAVEQSKVEIFEQEREGIGEEDGISQ
jgi:hypothetical protein